MASMRLLHAIGIILIVAWLALWLFVKITFAAVYFLLVVGSALIIIGLMRGSARPRV